MVHSISSADRTEDICFLRSTFLANGAGLSTPWARGSLKRSLMLLLVIKEARVTENTQRTDGQDESEVSQAGVPAVPASPALTAPAVATRNQAQPRRYRENPVRQLFPGWKYPTKLGKQDESYFQGYSNDIRALEET